MNADSNEKCSISECAARRNRSEGMYKEAIIQYHLLNDKESLIKPSPHREDAGQDDDAKHSEC